MIKKNPKFKKNKIVQPLWETVPNDVWVKAKEKVDDWLDTLHYVNIGPAKVKFNFGWYSGENFRLFALELFDVLWSRELGYLVIFDLQIAKFSVSLTAYPFD